MVKMLNRYSEGNTNRLSRPGRLNKNSGLTRVELLVLIACTAVLVAIFFFFFLPAHGRAKALAYAASCESNQKQLGVAFNIWAVDHSDKFSMIVSTNDGDSMEWITGRNMFKLFQTMSNQLNNPKVLNCPADDRKPANNFPTLCSSNISYFISLDADETYPAMLISGDRNLITNGVEVVPGLVVIRTNDVVGWSTKMHDQLGIFGLADGSVQLGSSGTFQKFLNRTGTNVSRLAVP
jgi:hypothetical protein